MARDNEQQDIERHVERDTKRQIAYREDFDEENLSDQEEPLHDYPSSANEGYPEGSERDQEMESSEYGELGAEERDFVYGSASNHGAGASEQEDLEDSNITPQSTSSTLHPFALSSSEEVLDNPSEIAASAISRAYALARLNMRLHSLSVLFSVVNEAEDLDEESNQQHEMQKQERIASLLTPVTLPLEDTCSICHEHYNSNHQPVMLPCEHVFGKQCISHWLAITNGGTCPLDRQNHRLFLEGVEAEETERPRGAQG